MDNIAIKRSFVGTALYFSFAGLLRMFLKCESRKRGNRFICDMSDNGVHLMKASSSEVGLKRKPLFSFLR
jgi:hypothetical protein